MKHPYKLLLFFFTAITLIGCDRITKDLAKAHLMNKPSSSYFYDTFRLFYIENTGAAMSIGENLPRPINITLFSIIPSVLLIGLCGWILKNSSKISSIKIFMYSFIIAGGLGNIFDRILYDRHVTHFMNVGIHNIRTGVFNVADLCVTTGAIGLILLYTKSTTKN